MLTPRLGSALGSITAVVPCRHGHSLARLVTVTAAIAAGCLLPPATARASTDHAAGVAHAASRATVKVAKTELGRVLVDARGRTLYLLTADERAKGKSVCYAACAKAWPPLLTTGRPVAGPGVKAALLGEATRLNGTRQVTYAGHRLYLFYKDARATQVNGQRLEGFGGPFCTASLAKKPCIWYAVSASGAAVTSASAAVASQAAGKPSASIDVGMKEFAFVMSTTRAHTGSVTFHLKNVGQVAHDFSIAGKTSPLLQPGKSADFEVTFTKKGAYPYKCTVPGHAQAGMKGVLHVA